MSKCNIRIGNGFDVHRLVENRELWLCGLNLPHTHGLLGHSDADVAIHALCDALLGAAALRDIGFHFPDNDPKFKNADSKKLLAQVVNLLDLQNYEIVNVDITICAEAPKINPHIEKMREILADIMKIDKTDVSIKATTTEKLGFVGRKEGISSYATALICKK